MDAKNDQEKAPACVPFFVHENAMTHYHHANRRMLIALIVSLIIMSAGFITLGGMFLSAYNDREKGWQEIVQQRLTEVAPDGVYQQPDPGAD